MLNQQILNLLTLQTGASWVKEVTGKVLCKKFMLAYKLTGSPKLTKQLVKLGLSEQQVSLAMTPARTDYKIWTGFESDVIVRLQGNSKAFKSCQRVTNPEDLKCWEGADYTNCQITEDVAPYTRGSLQFITFGNPITEDGVGWLARAKVRVLYSNYNQENEEVVGYFLDRPYGDASLLLSAFIDAYKDKGQLYMSDYYNLPVTTNLPDRDTLQMPSSRVGYQDSWNWYARVHQYQSQPLTVTAYQSRGKDKGTYATAIKNVVYNSQKCEFIKQSLKNNRAEVRAFKKSAEFNQIAIGLFGLDWKHFEDLTDTTLLYNNKYNINVYDGFARIYDSYDSYVEYLYYDNTPCSLKVYKDIPELGFYAGSRLWYTYEDDALRVSLVGTYSAGTCLTIDSEGNTALYHTSDKYWDENPGEIAAAMHLDINERYISSVAPVAIAIAIEVEVEVEVVKPTPIVTVSVAVVNKPDFINRVYNTMIATVVASAMVLVNTVVYQSHLHKEESCTNVTNFVQCMVEPTPTDDYDY